MAKMMDSMFADNDEIFRMVIREVVAEEGGTDGKRLVQK